MSEPQKFAAFVWIQDGALHVQTSGEDFYLLKKPWPELERQWVDCAKDSEAPGVFGVADGVRIHYVFQSQSYPQELPINAQVSGVPPHGTE